jgi:hypothetical protein
MNINFMGQILLSTSRVHDAACVSSYSHSTNQLGADRHRLRNLFSATSGHRELRFHPGKEIRVGGFWSPQQPVAAWALDRE